MQEEYCYSVLLNMYTSKLWVLASNYCNFMENVCHKGKNDPIFRTNQLPFTYKLVMVCCGAKWRTGCDSIYWYTVHLPTTSDEKGVYRVVSRVLTKARFQKNISILLYFWGISVVLVRLGCTGLHWNALKPHSHVGSTVLIHRNGHEKLHSSALHKLAKCWLNENLSGKKILPLGHNGCINEHLKTL